MVLLKHHSQDVNSLVNPFVAFVSEVFLPLLSALAICLLSLWFFFFQKVVEMGTYDM
jgi:hypothetical protein